MLCGCVAPSANAPAKSELVAVAANAEYGYDAMDIEVARPWTSDRKYSLSGFTVRSEGEPGIVIRVAYFANPPEKLLKEIHTTVPNGRPIEGMGWKGLIEFPEFKGKLAVGTGFLTGERGLVALQIEANEMVHSDDKAAITRMVCSVRPLAKSK